MSESSYNIYTCKFGINTEYNKLYKHYHYMIISQILIFI